MADVAGIGKVIIPMMTKTKAYTRGYAAAITAASATIGPIIPPSIPMVLYALVSNSSIGYLFLGGIVPGLLMAVALMLVNAYIAKKRHFPVEELVNVSQLAKRTYIAFPALLTPIILLYGIYGGVMTPTEAAAVAGAYALLCVIFFYRTFSFVGFYKATVESAKSSASTGLVISAALVINYVIVVENVPELLSEAFSGIAFTPLSFLLMINVLIFLLGFILDTSVIILVIIPLFLPFARELGIDMVYFGVIMVVNCMIGMITPPYGIILLVINNLTKIPLNEILRELIPFILTLIVALMVMIFNPSIILWLPRLFGYNH